MGVVQVWHVGRSGRIASAIMTIAFGVGAIGSVAAGFVVGDFSTVALCWLLAIVLAAVALASYRGGIGAHIEASDVGLLVQNPFSRVLLAWPEIKKVTPGYSGLVIERHSSGRRVQAWAVQKSNWDAARGKIVRADVVAREIAVRAEAAQGRPSEASIEPTPEERRALGRRARQAMVVGFSVLALQTAIRLLTHTF